MKDTKTRILNAAEKLFSEQGIGATSLRSITAEAGVNLASIHYHFGSRENLILRVFERRLGPINAERLNLLNEFGQRAGNSAIPLEKIIEAFIKPPLFCEDAIDDLPASFVQLIGRMHSEPKETQHLLMSLFGDVITSFIAELKKALPEQSEKDLFWNLKFSIGVLGIVLVGEETFRQVLEPELTQNRQATLERMIAFLAAGFRSSGDSPKS